MGISLTGSRVIVLALSTSLALTGTLLLAPEAAAAACDPEVVHSFGDLDGDNISDVVVGMPFWQDGFGAVDVRGSRSPAQQLNSAQLGGSRDDYDQVGAAVAIGDLDGDGCADLVVGAPGEGDPSGSGGYSGQVHIVLGSPAGIDPATAFVIPTSAAPSDQFGAALALEERGSVHDLYVGAPQATVNGVRHAGTVHRYTITPGGPRRVSVELRETRSQDSPDVPGSAEEGDRFGSVLSAVGTGRGVLVGAPLEDIGDRSNAGAVWFLRVEPSGAAGQSQVISQNTPGIAGRAESGDHFGAAVGANGRTAGIGVPGENSRRLRDSGLVQFMVLRAGNDRLAPVRAVSQKTPGIPGKLEAGDRFGSQVVVGLALLCREDVDSAIGSPGEDVGRHADAGTITLITNTGGCASRVVRQGAGMRGAAETGDGVGSVLTIMRGRSDADENYADRLLVGVPKEDVGSQADAGIVQPMTGDLTADGVLRPSLRSPEPFRSGAEYGSVLASTSR
jgi:hypothetical protein